MKINLKILKFIEDLTKIESIINEEKKVIKLGGLYVIGTERHESRRMIIS